MRNPSTLYRNGRVYSPADPGATALLVRGEAIEWLGLVLGGVSAGTASILTESLAKRCASASRSAPRSIRPTMTRPLDAPAARYC